jgi:UDP-glucose 4-epimerase
MSKILVTGGAGFIGSNLVDRLIAEGNQVIIIDDLSSGLESYLNPQATFYKLDICSAEIAAIFSKEKPDVVYHLAAQIEVPKSMSDPLHDAQINLTGGFNILENCRLHNVKKIIFASTGGAIYGEATEIPTSESYPTYPLSFYGIHKLTFEKYLNCYCQAYGLDYTVLRFSNVYGPRQFKGGEAGVIAIFTDNAVKGQSSFQYGDGTQTRDFVFVGDVVSGLVAALSINHQGEINISYGLESSLLQVRQALSIALGREIEIEEKPAKLGEQKRSCLSNFKAKEILNWEPLVNLEEGIAKTVAWARSQND